MTIKIGTATLAGNTVVITPPGGRFGDVEAVRLTNYTGEAITLTNIQGVGQGQEYLMPLQQMVYHTRNVSTIPTATGLTLGFVASSEFLFVEWSDDAINDFIGTYPTEIGLLGSRFATNLDGTGVNSTAGSGTPTLPDVAAVASGLDSTAYGVGSSATATGATAIGYRAISAVAGGAVIRGDSLKVVPFTPGATPSTLKLTDGAGYHDYGVAAGAPTFDGTPLTTGGPYQPLDADLTTIAALNSAVAGAMTTDGAGWIRKTYAQLKTALALVKADVGLGNVDNTSDVNKPVSTAQAAAIADTFGTIVAGALPTLVPVSGVAFQASVARTVFLTVPVTFNPTGIAAATCTVQLSPDGVTYSTLAVLTLPAVAALLGAVESAALIVPQSWFVKLTAVNAALGNGTYY